MVDTPDKAASTPPPDVTVKGGGVKHPWAQRRARKPSKHTLTLRRGRTRDLSA
jgi:hypothetical protein